MYNAISMPEDNAPRRRRPWRALLATLCLLGAVLFSVYAVQQAMIRLQNEPKDDLLSAAGPIAETTEQFVTNAPDNDPQVLTEVLPQIFQMNANLASVRIWNADGGLIGEVVRSAPGTVRTAREARLPDLGAKDAKTALLPYLRDTAWTDTIVQLQLLESEQGMLATQMEALAGDPAANADKSVRMRFYKQQDDIVQLAQAQPNTAKLITDARRDMDTVFDALTTDRADCLTRALEASDTVTADLTLGLTRYRARIDTIKSLPREFAAAAPTPQSWWVRIWPDVNGERVLVPLFTPADNEQLTVSAGFAEVIFYQRPGRLLDILGWRLIPGPALLLFALLLACRPRKRRQTTDEE